jgi:hypothetical protein
LELGFNPTSIVTENGVPVVGSYDSMGITIEQYGLYDAGTRDANLVLFGFLQKLTLGPPTCDDVISGGLDVPPPTNARMMAVFTPQLDFTIDDAAALCNYDHFNWLQVLTDMTELSPTGVRVPVTGATRYTNPSGVRMLTNRNGEIVLPETIDPPLGGWEYFFTDPEYQDLRGRGGDFLPYYYDEQPSDCPIFHIRCVYLIEFPDPATRPDPFTTFVFVDTPRGPGGLEMTFVTQLIGIPTDPTKPAVPIKGTLFNWMYSGDAAFEDCQGCGLSMRTANIGTVANVGRSTFLGFISPDDLTDDTYLLLYGAPRGGTSTDSVPPRTTANFSPAPNDTGWNNTNVTVTLIASDNVGGSGVKQVGYSLSGAQIGSAVVAGASASVLVTGEGTTTISYFASDNAGNAESPKTLTIKIDKTPPAIVGLPGDCSLWPPNHRMIQVATVSANDALSGLASLEVSATSNETPNAGEVDILISGSRVEPRTIWLRSDRLGQGTGRVYAITALATDLAGNIKTATATCLVPHDTGQ